MTAITAPDGTVYQYDVPPPYPRMSAIIRDVDGDTVHMAVDLGCDTTLDMTLRLMVSCREHGTPEGDAATAFTTAFLSGGRFEVRTVKDKKEKYGRYKADLINEQGLSLCVALLKAGLADMRETKG